MGYLPCVLVYLAMAGIWVLDILVIQLILKQARVVESGK